MAALLSAAVLLPVCARPEPQPPVRGGQVAATARPAPGAQPGSSLAEVRRGVAGQGLPGGAERAARGYPRFPDVHDGVVVFCDGGDLWEVSSKGGLARRLTVDPGEEIFPKFSPDGKLLAFSGSYDGNQDVFVMPSAGGRPRRLTFHPAWDEVLGWTSDGRSVLFRSFRDHPAGDWTLYTVPATGGDPVRLPLGRGARLTFEPGGHRVAINRVSRDRRHWKRYAGGKAAQIFVGDLSGAPFRKLTTFLGSNAYPMWHGGRIYFLSDRTGTMNLWSMTPEGKDLRQHTRHARFDARFPSLSQGQIVYQHRFGLRLLDLASGKDRAIPLTVLSDARRTRVRFTNPARYLGDFDLSPHGAYLGLGIRGNLHRVPAVKGGRRIQVSRSSASRERDPAFSPDGRWIAAVSDASGEDEIVLFDARGQDPPRQLTKSGDGYKFAPIWSPDGKWLAWADSNNRLFVVSAQGGAPRLVDRSQHGRFSGCHFSPDSLWLAFAKSDPNYFASVFLYDLTGRRIHRVTDEYHDDWSPRFSPDGKYLVFLSDRTVNPILDHADSETILDQRTKPYLVLLSKETRSPFLPKRPGESDKGPKAAGQGTATGAHPSPPPSVAPIRIDLEGLAGRVVEVPVKAGNLRGLFVGRGALLYVRIPTLGMVEWEQQLWGKEFTVPLHRFDLSKKKETLFHPAIAGYAVSADGKKVALRLKKARFAVFAMGAKAPAGKALAEHTLSIRTLREEVDPRKEWRQVFDEAWRMMRDFYWTPTMAGVDWKAMYRKYRPFLDQVTTRRELSDLLGEMVAELSLGHTYVWGGDQRHSKHVSVGLLGADLAPDPSGRYRFAKIFPGANWDPQRRSPLTEPGVDVKEGEFLLRIDGQEVHAGDNVYRYLQKAAGQRIALTVNHTPTAPGARQVVVKTLRSERALRYYAWVKHNRELVARRTKSRVGYLHLPDMMTRGMVEFDRWFYPQVRKEGLIVDARWNHGGFVSQILIKRLARRILSWSRGRSGWVGPYPRNTLNGRIVVLTNESAGSDGDIFPRAIQVAKIGPVIGTRTWGGVVGISLRHRLVDRGISTRPTFFAWWEPRRHWQLEGQGVVPDIEVYNDPAATFRGVDAQLDRGIAEILRLLKAAPPHPPTFGPPPDKSKKAWVKRYGKTDAP